MGASEIEKRGNKGFFEVIMVEVIFCERVLSSYKEWTQLVEEFWPSRAVKIFTDTFFRRNGKRFSPSLTSAPIRAWKSYVPLF